jgi:hypothetical protein
MVKAWKERMSLSRLFLLFSKYETDLFKKYKFLDNKSSCDTIHVQHLDMKTDSVFDMCFIKLEV